jgi:hypothetical protein
LVQGARPIIGLGYRTVYRGAVVIVRTDRTLPNCVDVECYVGTGKKEHVYRLSKFDFISIERFLADLTPYRLERNKANINYLANRKKLELAGLRRDEAAALLEEIGYGRPQQKAA